jgi:hypothetical protein
VNELRVSAEHVNVFADDTLETPRFPDTLTVPLNKGDTSNTAFPVPVLDDKFPTGMFAKPSALPTNVVLARPRVAGRRKFGRVPEAMLDAFRAANAVPNPE